MQIVIKRFQRNLCSACFLRIEILRRDVRQLREIKGTRYSTNKCEREIKENNDNNNIER